MAPNPNQQTQIEGAWDDLIRHPGRFAGLRVRVTVLSDGLASPPSISNDIRRWLAEGDVVEAMPPNRSETDSFGQELVEKFRKQGLVL
jgi:hypothetical protein